jgi:hypothetical protein
MELASFFTDRKITFDSVLIPRLGIDRLELSLATHGDAPIDFYFSIDTEPINTEPLVALHRDVVDYGPSPQRFASISMGFESTP